MSDSSGGNRKKQLSQSQLQLHSRSDAAPFPASPPVSRSDGHGATTRSESILVFDVETDGPSLTENSMVMIGIVIIDASCSDPFPPRSVSEFKAERVLDHGQWCLSPLPGRSACPKTTHDFWNKHPALRDFVATHAKDAASQIIEINRFIQRAMDEFKVKAWLASPSHFDYMWIRQYMSLFEEQLINPLPFFKNGWHRINVIDYRTMVNTLEMTGMKSKHSWHVLDSTELQHSHYAIDDAMELAFRYILLLYDISSYPKHTRVQPYHSHAHSYHHSSEHTVTATAVTRRRSPRPIPIQIPCADEASMF